MAPKIRMLTAIALLGAAQAAPPGDKCARCCLRPHPHGPGPPTPAASLGAAAEPRWAWRRVTSIPGFGPFPFNVYSGYLAVPGPIPSACDPTTPFESLSIHYQLNMVQDPSLAATAPVVAW